MACKGINWAAHDIIPRYNMNGAKTGDVALKNLREAATLFDFKVSTPGLDHYLKRNYAIIAHKIDEIVKEAVNYFDAEKQARAIDYRNCALPILERRQ